MSIFKTLTIFVAIIFVGSTIFSTAKEVREDDYSSSEPSAEVVKQEVKEKRKFDYQILKYLNKERYIKKISV